MSQSVEFEGLGELDKAFQAFLEKRPEKRREMHKRVAEAVAQEVDAEIDASGLDDSEGTVKSWQEGVVGSGGGYAAVRAVKGETGANSPGATTNYLENGHKVRSGKSTRVRAKKAYVDGFHFYQAAEEKAQEIALAEAEKYADEMAGILEG